MACKSPTHRNYRLAEEGLYIQAHLASRDLIEALDKARAANPENPGSALIHESRLDTAVERLVFGQSELEEALRALDAHFDRGCSNVPAEVTA